MQPMTLTSVKSGYPFSAMDSFALPATASAAASSTTVASASAQESRVVQQVKEWLDTPKGKLTTTQIWAIIEKLSPLENYQMLLHAIELLKGRLSELPSNVRLLWVLQNSLRTLDSTLLSLDNKPVLKSRALCLELSEQFWKTPPIAFFRDLHCLLQALENTPLEGTTDSFKNLVKDKENWKNQAAFLRNYLYNCFTVDPQDTSRTLPFVDLGEVHDFLQGKSVILFFESFAFEVVSSTDFRIFNINKEDISAPTIEVKDLPSAQKTQLLEKADQLKLIVDSIFSKSASTPQQCEQTLLSLLLPLMHSFRDVLEKEKDFNDQDTQKLIVFLSVFDFIGFFEQLRRMKCDPTAKHWENFLKDFNKFLMSCYDEMSLQLNLIDDSFMGLLVRLSRTKRREIFERVNCAFREGKAFAPILNDYFTQQQVDSFLQPSLPQKVRSLMETPPVEAIKELAQVHSQLVDRESSQFTLLGETYQKKSAQGKQLLEFFKDVAYCSHVLQPHFESLAEEVQSQIRFALIGSFSNFPAFFPFLEMFCPRSSFPELWHSLEQSFPAAKQQAQKQLVQTTPAAASPPSHATSSNSNTSTQATSQDLELSAKEMMEQIASLIPAHLQSEYQKAFEQDPLFGPPKFIQTHMSELGPDFLLKIMSLAQDNQAFKTVTQWFKPNLRP